MAVATASAPRGEVDALDGDLPSGESHRRRSTAFSCSKKQGEGIFDMTLIRCPECGKKVSDAATHCPKCGQPFTPDMVADIKKKEAEEEKRDEKIGIGCLVVFLVAVIIIWNIISGDDSDEGIPVDRVIVDLTSYGKMLEERTKGAVTFVSAMETIPGAFQITFATDRPELLSAAGAKPGNAAYYTNVGRTELWKVRFCTSELEEIMQKYGVTLVSGNLTDGSGTTQSMAVC